MRKIFRIVASAAMLSGFFATSRAQTSILDRSFGTNGTVTAVIAGGDSSYDQGFSVAIQSDGKILEAGWSTDIYDHYAFAVARFNTDGSLDNTFGSGGTTRAYIAGGDSDDLGESLAIQSDGKIVVAGYSTDTTGGSSSTAIALARFDSNGTLDNSFGTNGSVRAFVSGADSSINTGLDVKIQPDGKIVVVGCSVYNLVFYGMGVARFNSNGTPDNTFGANGSTLITTIGVPAMISEGYSLAFQSDGKIVVAGSSVSSSTGSIVYAAVRLNSNGAVDNTFGSGGYSYVDVSGPDSDGFCFSVAVQPDDKIVLAGSSIDTTGGQYRVSFAVARLDSDGTIDSSFGTDGVATTNIAGGNGYDDVAYAVAVQPDGKIVAAGSSYSHLQGGNGFAVARFNSNGSADSTFGTNGTVLTNTFDPGGDGEDNAYSIAIQSDGKIVVAGYTEGNAGGTAFALARYLSSNLLGIRIGKPVPRSFALFQNYPNPFNPTTTINYQLPISSNVTVKVYYILGREVATLVSGKETAGSYSVTFDGSKLASGVYFYRLVAGKYASTKKLVLMK